MPHSSGLLNDFCVIYYVCKYFRRLAASSSITLTLSGFEHNQRLLRRIFFLFNPDRTMLQLSYLVGELFSIIGTLSYFSKSWFPPFFGSRPKLFFSVTQFLRKRRNQRCQESTNKLMLVFLNKNLINPSVCHVTSSMPRFEFYIW